MQEKYRFLWVRHAESEGNVDPRMYLKKGDSNVSLTDLGWMQAFGTSNFLTQYYQDTNTTAWPTIFLSSYRRPQDTFSAIFHGANDNGLKSIFRGKPKLNEEYRLSEKFFGAASALAHPEELFNVGDWTSEEKKNFLDNVNAIKRLSNATYKNDPFVAPHILGEATLATCDRVKGFSDGTLHRDVLEGKNDFLIVSHGAIVQAEVMNWFHIPMRAKRELGTPGNGDVIAIEGGDKNWTAIKIYDGEAMKPCNINLIENINYLTVDTLPEIPNHILSQASTWKFE